MSGGVDSAVAAARAVDAGHEVVGVHLALSRTPGTLRVHRVFDGAAPAAAGAQGAGHATEREVHPDDVVSGLDGAGGSNGRIDPTTHRCQHSHGSSVNACFWAPAVPEQVRGCR